VIDLPRRDAPRAWLVVCGDNPLAYRLTVALADDADVRVTVVLRSRAENHGPRIAAVPGVRVVEAPLLSAEALRTAGVAKADALALVEPDDVANIHAALRAQELNPNLRLVIRFFNMSLGYRIRELFPGSAVLSDSATAAPLFVAAALGEVPTSYARLPGREHAAVYVANRSAVPAKQVLFGLADTTAEFGQRRLPRNDAEADLVLALANGPVIEAPAAGRPARLRRLRPRLPAARRPDSDNPGAFDVGAGNAGLFGASLYGAGLVGAGARGVRVRRSKRTAFWVVWARARAVVSRTLAFTALGLLVLLGLGVVALAIVAPMPWWDAAYLVVLDAAGAAQPDVGLSGFEKVVQALITVAGITFIPVVTAAVVDAIVKARLATALGRPPALHGHVVVAGLGNVGSRVLAQLHDLGVPVIGVEQDTSARGVQVARRLGVPVLIGDASRDGVLRDASLADSRALVAVTNNDVTNLEAALQGRAMRNELRVVLRLFDDDLAERVERSFQINISRSVSYLAAPAFTAAMLGRQVLATIPIGRQVLLIAELPIGGNSAMIGLPVRAAGVPRLSRVIAVQPRGAENLQLPAPQEHTLEAGDRLVVVATRTGLARLSTWSNPARAPKRGDNGAVGD
jgi:Trk K+ transport system NAD-binding subunit